MPSKVFGIGVSAVGYVANIVFCESAEEVLDRDKKSKTNAMGLLARGSVLSIPSFLSLTVVVIVNDNKSEPMESIKLAIKNPNNFEIFATDTIQRPAIPENLEIKDSILDFTVTVNFQNLVIDQVGYFSFEVFVNEKIDYVAKLYIGKSQVGE